MTDKLFLVLDGNALLHRAWHAIPPLSTADGRVVNAVYGFTNVVEKMLEKHTPDYMAVAWDLPGKTFRHEAYADYKGTRKKKEPELYEQIPMIQEVLSAYGIPSLSHEGLEADDVIGTLAGVYGPKDGIKVLVVTGDLDALQLVNKDVDVLTFVKGFSQTKTYDIQAVKDRYGLNPDQVIDLKALMGDSSDNIPGLAGVGQKTATALLQEHQSIEGIYKAIEDGFVPEKFAKKFRGQEEKVEEMKHLVTIVKDADIDFELEDASFDGGNPNELQQIFDDYEFRTLALKYANQIPEDTDKPENQPKMHHFVEGKPGGSVRYILQTEEGIVLSDGHVYESIALTDLKLKLSSIETLIGNNLKETMHAAGSSFDCTLFDIGVAAYLIDSNTRDYSTAALAKDRFDRTIEDNMELLQAMIDLHKNYQAQLQEDGILDLSTNIEMPLIRTLYVMEAAGVEVDKDHLGHLSEMLLGKIDALTARIHDLAGKKFNIKSPAQLSEVLFDDLGLPTAKIKKTKTAYSTAASELEKLWDEHEIIPLISEYREYTKLKSTYIDVLPELVAEDGRLHTSFNQTVAATGRLSSSDPNLQNIPIRTELGNEIRKAFVAPKGRVLLAADYSQIELRIVAEFSKDKNLIDTFKEDADIHARTAARIMDKDEADVTKNDRRIAKAVNFGILYGMGSRALGKSVGIGQKEAKAFIERYFELYPGMKAYMDSMKLMAHEQGYVETAFGRRRYFPEIESGIQMLVAQAERMAINMPVQGTQADLVKLAMNRVQEWLDQNDIDAKLLLQVHDELILEVKEGAVEMVAAKVVEIMAAAWKTEVPLKVNVETGTNWGELYPLK